jgi:ABC-type transport system substrate-binding protein
MDTTQAPFTDIRVRQAFKLAVDRKAVPNTVFAGFGEVTNDLMMAPGDPYYPDGLTQVTYNPARAKNPLAGVGFPGGVDIGLWAFGTYSPLGVAYADTAKAAGIRAKVRQGNPDTFWDTTDWGQWFPGDLLCYTYGSGSVAYESKLNFPAIDDLYNKALRITDTEQQKSFKGGSPSTDHRTTARPTARDQPHYPSPFP